jgi:galactose oxidase-like protein
MRASPTSAQTAEPPNATPTPGPVSWSALTVGPGPARREDHTWTLASDAKTALLFGGRDGSTVYDDLWAYDLARDAWTRLAPDGPAPPGRFGHNAVWVDGTGLVVFAGQNGADFYNDLWAYDPAANGWRRLPAIGELPVARYGSCAAVGPDARLWISHGFTSEGTRFADTRAYDFELTTWTDETPTGDLPVNRCLHACWWTTDGRFVLYGGSTTGVTALGDEWALGKGVWTQIGQARPPARNLYAAVQIEPGITLVFGGQGLKGGYLDDAWLFNETRPSPIALVAEGAPPPPRSGAEMVLDLKHHRVLLFGGKNDSGALGDLWGLELGG